MADSDWPGYVDLSSQRSPRNAARQELLKTYVKQGHIFCGCCCDTRRATIILNIVAFIFCAICVGGLYIDYLTWSDEYSYYDAFTILEDDDIQSDVESLIEDYRWAFAAFGGVCIFMNLVGIIGAMHYNACAVLLSALWYFLIGILVTAVIGLGGIMIFVSAFFAYPNIVFYQELSEGIMTKENYPNEVHSCCCVPNKRKVSIREAIERRLGIFA